MFSSQLRAEAGTCDPRICKRNEVCYPHALQWRDDLPVLRVQVRSNSWADPFSMKHFLTLLSHEVRMLLVNPSTYIAAVLFLGVMGFVFTGILETYSKAPQELSPAYVFRSEERRVGKECRSRAARSCQTQTTA